jgi:hypothetical protein
LIRALTIFEKKSQVISRSFFQKIPGYFFAESDFTPIYFLKSSTMVGETFEIYTSEMAKNALKILHHGWRKF